MLFVFCLLYLDPKVGRVWSRGHRLDGSSLTSSNAKRQPDGGRIIDYYAIGVHPLDLVINATVATFDVTNVCLNLQEVFIDCRLIDAGNFEVSRKRTTHFHTLEVRFLAFVVGIALSGADDGVVATRPKDGERKRT